MTAPGGSPPAGAPIATGSGLERAMACRASNVLPRVWSGDSAYSARGTAIHSYLERISNGSTLDESLAMVDDEHRAVCEGLDLDGLQFDQLSAEVTLVVHLPTGRARILGQSLERDYSGVDADEVPMTIDLVGVNLPARRGKVADHKTGWSKRTPAADNWQIKGAAVALAAVYDLDEVDGELLMHREGKAPWHDRATFGPADLLIARGELAELHTRAQADRGAYATGAHVEPTEGDWCRYCPSRWSCPAKVGTIRAALATDPGQAIVPRDAGQLLGQIDAGIKALTALKSQIYGLAAMEPILLRVDEDGTETWLGEHTSEGNERLDAAIAIDVAAEVLGVPAEESAAFVRSIAKLEVTKTALTRECVARAPKRAGSKRLDEILGKIRDAGGATRKTRDGVQVYTVAGRLPTGAA